jgi:hypothetical protein
MHIQHNIKFDVLVVVSFTWPHTIINPLTPELNPSAQRCLMVFFTGDFAS